MRIPTLLIATAALTFSAVNVQAHCQVPCGIFDNHARIHEVEEHITTIAKASRLIRTLSEDEKPDLNQIVRWVNTKEDHAIKIQKIATDYFLAQRVKPASPEDAEAYKTYQKQLETIHHVVFWAMKAKQSTETAPIDKLTAAVKELNKLFVPKDHSHDHNHGHTH